MHALHKSKNLIVFEMISLRYCSEGQTRWTFCVVGYRPVWL